MDIAIYRQNLMLALRLEMGWPEFKPANDCIAWSAGRRIDFSVSQELAHLAETMRKDLIYSGWADGRATEPTSFAVAFRELASVDIVDRVVPYAVNYDAPIMLVSTRADETFALDHRGSLTRIPGKPKQLGKGRKLAMKRIKASAAARGNRLLESNQLVPPGGTWTEPEEELTGTVVRFG